MERRTACTISYKHKSGVFVAQKFGGPKKGIPGTVEAQIAGMKYDEWEATANFIDDFRKEPTLDRLESGMEEGKDAPPRTTVTLSGATPLATMRSRISSPRTITRAACLQGHDDASFPSDGSKRWASGCFRQRPSRDRDRKYCKQMGSAPFARRMPRQFQQSADPVIARTMSG